MRSPLVHSPPMSIARALTPDAAEAFAELRREMLADAPWAFCSSPGHDRGSDPAMVRAQLIRPDNAILAVQDAGRVIAAAGLHREEPPKRHHIATIWGVYVTPGARGRGLGRSVVSAAIETARTWPRIEAVILTVSENAPAARALYESLGFIPWGFEPDALRVDGRSYAETHMRLPI